MAEYLTKGGEDLFTPVDEVVAETKVVSKKKKQKKA